MSTEYTHEDMDYLSDMEHIRLRPGLYIGMTEHPTHLIYELFDNALDEAKAGYAKTIAIVIDSKKNEASVIDNGRGIPYKDNTVIKISTKLFSGGKFKKNEKTAYSIASGLHGIGIVAVNALSDFLHITIYRDGEKATVNFEKGEVVKQEVEPHVAEKPFSTRATFRADKQYFEGLKFDLGAIRERMRVASVHVPNLTLALIVDGKKEIIKTDMATYFNEVLLSGSEKENVTQILDTTSKVKDESVSFTFCWEMNVAAAHRANGCVNMLSVNQGTHINYSIEALRNVFEKLAAEKKITKFNKYDMMIGLRCYTSVMLYEPEYSSQTKERLSVSKNDLNHLYERLEKKLYALLSSKSDYVDFLFNYWKIYKNKKESKGTIVKSSDGQVTRYNQSIDSKLRDCTTHNVSESELFIVEGTSAGGSIIQARDPRIHAVLGLRGKVLNIADNKKEFLKNKEIVEIINALGTSYWDEFDIQKLRYSKIITACDADSDGAHITCLVLTALLQLVPDLIKEGKVYTSIMPLYGTRVKKQFVPIYNDEELAKYREHSPNAKIQRYKGLGEMDPDQLAEVLLNPNQRRLEQVQFPDNPQDIFDLMTKAELKREIV